MTTTVRSSGKHFCIVCAYEKNSVGKYKETKTSNFCEKCNVYVCKNCFERDHTHSQPKRKYNIFAMKVSFSFHSFSVNILPVLKSEAFTWGEEWVIAVQTILW